MVRKTINLNCKALPVTGRKNKIYAKIFHRYLNHDFDTGLLFERYDQIAIENRFEPTVRHEKQRSQKALLDGRIAQSNLLPKPFRLEL
jgi:hypothetical protein